MKLIDLTGRRFGRLLVVEKHGNKGKAVAWLCKCDCGSEVIVRGHDLRNGATQSCGCIHKEQLVERNTTHGLYGTRLYNIWGCMAQRCYNEKTPPHRCKYQCIRGYCKNYLSGGRCYHKKTQLKRRGRIHRGLRRSSRYGN